MKTSAYDVIVVGAGSAGCALVGRLCQSPGLSVCLVEAGPDYGSFRSGRWPEELLSIQQLPETHDWGYNEERTGFSSPEARAKVVGGCSTHNQCGAFWGLPDDYDAWAAAGNPGWSYANLTPLLEQIEQTSPEARSAYRGTSGVIETRPYRVDELASWQRLVLEAGQAAGLPRLTDLSAPEPAEGGAPFHANIKGTIRWNAAFAFLDPVRTHPGLTILSNTMAERLVLHHTTAVSLICHTQGNRLELRASRFVLCCGTYGTPLLLMRSGIGPAQNLQELGILPLLDIPGVGQNLHDHPGISMDFEPSALAQRLLEEDLTHQRFFQSQVVLRAKSRQCSTGFDLHLVPYQSRKDGQEASFSILLFHLAPRSRGQVLLRGKEVHLPPKIDFRFFTDPGKQDASAVMDGLDLIRRLVHVEPLANAVKRETEPGQRVRTVRDLGEYAHTHLISYRHASGTCKMGPPSDPTAVVDSSGQVYGTQNIFVADASLMPRIPRAPTNFTCFLIGLHIADLLSKKM